MAWFSSCLLICIFKLLLGAALNPTTTLILVECLVICLRRTVLPLSSWLGSIADAKHVTETQKGRVRHQLLVRLMRQTWGVGVGSILKLQITASSIKAELIGGAATLQQATCCFMIYGVTNQWVVHVVCMALLCTACAKLRTDFWHAC